MNYNIKAKDLKVKINFSFQGENKILEFEKKEIMENIFKIYAVMIEKDVKNVFFYIMGI